MSRFAAPSTRAVRPVQVDFLRPGRAPSAAGRWVVAAASLAVAAVSLQLVRTATRLDALDRQAALAPSSAPARTISSADAKATAREAAQARAVVARLATPWDGLFADLEAAAGADTTLVAIQQEDNGRHVRIAGEARDFAAVLAYVGRLQQARGLADVLLASHDATGAAGVRFAVTAEWRTP